MEDKLPNLLFVYKKSRNWMPNLLFLRCYKQIAGLSHNFLLCHTKPNSGNFSIEWIDLIMLWMLAGFSFAKGWQQSTFYENKFQISMSFEQKKKNEQILSEGRQRTSRKHCNFVSKIVHNQRAETEIISKAPT